MNKNHIALPASSTANACIVPLKEAVNPAQFGEKACRLAEMQHLGYPVPDGVVIAGSFFSETFQRPELRNFIDTRVRGLTVEDLTEIAESAKSIAARISEIRLPNTFTEHLAEMVSDLLRRGPVAVRSSACGEDSNDAAFAGQLDTFLGITTFPELRDAILKCWASYWSHRSLAYQLARRSELGSMGVIIQQQVDAKYSGVMFTRNVQNPATHQLVIEFCQGLGEQLVSGQITPVSLITDPMGNRIQTNQVNCVTTDGLKAVANTDALSPVSIHQLVQTGRDLETHFDHPQDIEWSLNQDDEIRILQSRPITTMTKPERGVIWSNANVNENFPDPICPLLYSIASRGYYHYFRNLAVAFAVAPSRIDAMEYPLRNIIGTHAGRMYYNLSNIHAVLRAVPFGEFLADSFNQFVGSESTSRNRDSPSWKSLSRGRFSELREALSIIRNAMKRFRSLETGIARFETTIDRFAKDSEPAQLPELDSQKLLSLWRRFITIRSRWTDAAMADATSMIYYRLTGLFLAKEFTSEQDRAMVNRLLSGLCDIVSGLPTEKLWDLSRSIREHEALSRALMHESPEQTWNMIESEESLSGIFAELKDFLDNWGFRCSGELMLTTACYQEVPSTLMPLLASYVRLDGPSPREHLETQQQLREQATQSILKQLQQKWLLRLLPFPRKSHIASWLLRSTQRSVACRERARLKQALLYSRFRQIALAIGKLLAQQNHLESSDDIFYLTYEEVEDLLCGSSMLPSSTAQTALLRRKELETLGQFTPPDRLELPAGQFWQPDGSATDMGQPNHQWNEGIGVSGGKIIGRAVVLTSPDQFEKVSRGDVLVTRQTDPGWGPILFLVRGLVMERGGMLSHGAILAREYGIPTAVGIDDATKRIKTGDTIEVDGDRGRVEILS